MFDEIHCDAPLPDRYDTSKVWFQSKSFPDCCLCRYTITAAGRLIDSRGNDLEPEGYLIFFTDDDAPEELASGRQPGLREYRARFAAGQLQAIERVAPDEPSDCYHGPASFRWFNSPSFLFGDPDETAESEEGDNA